LIEEMLMMRPKPLSRMALMIGRVMLNSESRLVRITSDHCSWLIFCSMASREMPALLTSTSIGPDFVLDVDDPLLAGGVIAHVPFEDRDLGFLVERLGRLVVAAVIDGDVIASLLQRLCGRGADTARAARDQSYPSHACPPLKKRFFGACLDDSNGLLAGTREDTNEN
jgi:hypothetical protein